MRSRKIEGESMSCRSGVHVHCGLRDVHEGKDARCSTPATTTTDGHNSAGPPGEGEGKGGDRETEEVEIDVGGVPSVALVCGSEQRIIEPLLLTAGGYARLAAADGPSEPCASWPRSASSCLRSKEYMPQTWSEGSVKKARIKDV